MKKLQNIANIYFILIILITAVSLTSCLSLLFGTVNINKLKKEFEKIPNVKVLDIWEQGDFGEYADAIILINNEKLLVFEYFTKDSFKNNKGIVRIKRIANWKLVTKYYGYIGVSKIGGGPVKSYGWTFALDFDKCDIFLQNNNLPEINKIQDVIENYDLIFNVINSLELDNYWYEYSDLDKDMIYWIKKERVEQFIYDEQNDTHNIHRY